MFKFGLEVFDENISLKVGINFGFSNVSWFYLQGTDVFALSPDARGWTAVAVGNTAVAGSPPDGCSEGLAKVGVFPGRLYVNDRLKSIDHDEAV